MRRVEYCGKKLLKRHPFVKFIGTFLRLTWLVNKLWIVLKTIPAAKIIEILCRPSLPQTMIWILSETGKQYTKKHQYIMLL